MREQRNGHGPLDSSDGQRLVECLRESWPDKLQHQHFRWGELRPRCARAAHQPGGGGQRRCDAANRGRHAGRQGQAEEAHGGWGLIRLHLAACLSCQGREQLAMLPVRETRPKQREILTDCAHMACLCSCAAAAIVQSTGAALRLCWAAKSAQCNKHSRAAPARPVLAFIAVQASLRLPAFTLTRECLGLARAQLNKGSLPCLSPGWASPALLSHRSCGPQQLAHNACHLCRSRLSQHS